MSSTAEPNEWPHQRPGLSKRRLLDACILAAALFARTTFAISRGVTGLRRRRLLGACILAATLFAGTTFAISGGVTALRQGTPVTEDETIALNEFQNSVDRLKAATRSLRAVRVPDRAQRWLVGTPTIRIDLGDHIDAGEHLGFRVIALHGATGKASTRPFQPTVTTSDSDLCEVHKGAYGTNNVPSLFTLEAKAPGTCLVFASLDIAGDLTVDADPVALSITTPAPLEETLAPEVTLTSSDGSQMSTPNPVDSSPTDEAPPAAKRTEHSIYDGIFRDGAANMSDTIKMSSRNPTVAFTSSHSLDLTLTSSTPAVCSIPSGGSRSGRATYSELELHQEGQCTVTASHPGDATYEPASTTLSITVTRTEHSIYDGIFRDGAANMSDTIKMSSRNPTVAFTSSHSLDLTLTSSTPAVCSIPSGGSRSGRATYSELELHQEGQCTVTASHPGDATYEPASTTLSITVVN